MDSQTESKTEKQNSEAEVEKARIINQLLEITAIPQVERYFQAQGDLLCKFCRKPGHLFRNCIEKEVQCLRYYSLQLACRLWTDSNLASRRITISATTLYF